MIKTFFGSHTEKGLHVYYGEDKSQIQTHFNSLIHHTMRTKVSKHLCQNFGGFLWVVSEILPGFLTNQNFLGCACTPCIPASYTTVETGIEIKYRDSITAIHGVK